MKSLIFSTCALILLVGIIIYNGIYIKNVTSDLIEKAENITYENKKSTEEFRKLWEENEHKICISVSHKVKEIIQTKEYLILLPKHIGNQVLPLNQYLHMVLE